MVYNFGRSNFLNNYTFRNAIRKLLHSHQITISSSLAFLSNVLICFVARMHNEMEKTVHNEKSFYKFIKYTKITYCLIYVIIYTTYHSSIYALINWLQTSSCL